MALGVDTIAAEVAVKLQIPFVAAIPFDGQESSWEHDAQAHYHALLSLASSQVCVGTSDQIPWVYQKRNEFMVDNADMVVAVWNGQRSGTRNCVDYAIKKSIPVWRLDPRTYKIGRYDGTKIVAKTLHV